MSLLGRVNPRRYPLILGYILVGVAVSIVGAFILGDLARSSRDAAAAYSDAVRRLDLIGELQFQIQEARRSMLYSLTTSDSNLQVQYADESRAADERVALMSDHQAMLTTAQDQAEAAGRFKQDWNDYLVIRDDVIASILEGETQAAVQKDLQQGAPLFNRVRDDLKKIQELYNAQGERQLASVTSQSSRSRVKLIAVLVLTQLLAILGIAGLQRKMTRGLQESEASLRVRVQERTAELSLANQNLKEERSEERRVGKECRS